MSKALLKKSLAFVKSGRSDESDVSRPKGKDVKKNLKKKEVKAKSHTTAVADPEKNLIYFTKQRTIKKKIIKTVSESAVQKERRLYLTPAQLAQEKRRIRLQRRKKKPTKPRGQERNPFSIFSIPHLAS